jgi:hypothetical protein
MIYNLLNVRIHIADFHVETNAVVIYLSDFSCKDNVITKKNKYIMKSTFGNHLYFSWINYIKDHPTATCIIDYPLGTPCEFKVELGRIDELVDQICGKYREIYLEKDKWKVWGHDIRDLQLWGILLDTKTNILRLGVDS